MSKRNIKIILIGVLVLVFFGLIYSFLSSKPEIVSDTSMRSNEPVPPVPTPAPARSVVGESDGSYPVVSAEEVRPEAQVPVVVLSSPEPETPAEATEVTSTVLDVTTEVSAAEPMSSDIAGVFSAVGVAVSPLPLDLTELMQDAQAQSDDPDETQNVSSDQEVADDEQALVNNTSQGEGEVASVEDALDSAGEAQSAEPILAVDSDVEILTEQTGFLDLNLTETTAIDLQLIEGDDLILEDINEDLTKYQTVVATTIAAQSALVAEVQAPISGEGGAVSNDNAEVELAESAVSADGEGEEPAVISIPDPDDALMNGVGELSEQYRETYARLQLVTSKLGRANEKNKALKGRFVKAADQNREMAEKINLINQKIIELTTQ